MIDLEHSTMPLDIAAQLCAVAHDLGLFAFVRVPERDYGSIGRLLDGGAIGITAPRIQTVDEARTVVEACRFPPRGRRSQVSTVPQLGFRPMRAGELGPLLDEATIVQVMLETPAAVAAADAVAALDGLDMIILGANDFLAELGCLGRYDDPRLREAVTSIAAACNRHGKLLMVGGVSDASLVSDFRRLGAAPVQITGFDTDFLFAASEARVVQIRRFHENA